MPRQPAQHADKPAELIQAEREGQEALRLFFRRDIGVQAAIARTTGIHAPVLSRMGSGRSPISVEHAMLISVATNGELTASKLCPSRADLLDQYTALHGTRTTETA